MSNSSFGPAELLQCSRGLLFGQDAPRLPGEKLMAFDAISDIATAGGKYGHGYAVARKSLSSIAWVFDNHFEGDPVMPGSLQIEGLLQLAGFFGAWQGLKGKGRALRVDGIRFLVEVVPQSIELCYRIDVKKLSESHALVIAEGVVEVDGDPCTYARELWVTIKPPNE